MMNNDTIQVVSEESQPTLVKPESRIPGVSIRVATAGADDFEFIDALQKAHSKMLGFMPRMQLQNYIEAGDVLIAEGIGNSVTGEMPLPRKPIGYCIGRDRYFKHDDVGIIYQLCVSPGSQRSLIGALLVKAMFERAAYGCKLFCCWCAQDLEANYFWESLGFVPLAFRTGSSGKQRIHIFWQARTRENNQGPAAAPYWFPSSTTGGAIRADRLVLPIPPGTHWRDAKPVVLPGGPGMDNEQRTLESGEPERPRKRKKIPKSTKPASAPRGGLWFAPQPSSQPDNEPRPKKTKKKPKVKNDPKLVAAARELRDRWLEEVERCPELLSSEGKYDVSRALPAPGNVPVPEAKPVRLLDAA